MAILGHPQHKDGMMKTFSLEFTFAELAELHELYAKRMRELAIKSTDYGVRAEEETGIVREKLLRMQDAFEGGVGRVRERMSEIDSIIRKDEEKSRQ